MAGRTREGWKWERVLVLFLILLNFSLLSIFLNWCSFGEISNVKFIYFFRFLSTALLPFLSWALPATTSYSPFMSFMWSFPSLNTSSFSLSSSYSFLLYKTSSLRYFLLTFLSDSTYASSSSSFFSFWCHFSLQCDWTLSPSPSFTSSSSSSFTPPPPRPSSPVPPHLLFYSSAIISFFSSSWLCRILLLLLIFLFLLNLSPHPLRLAIFASASFLLSDLTHLHSPPSSY